MTKNKPDMNNQSGSSISKVVALYNKYLVDPSKHTSLTPKDFAEMRAKDGTIMALTNLLTLPILASGWDIEPDEANDPDGAQAEFVKSCLTMTPEQGGMSTPFHLVLADMLRSTYEGWRGFEKVYTLSPDNKIVFKKIVSYPSETLHIDIDEKGDFEGFTQTINGEPVKIDKRKCVLVTHGKERDWLKGESMLLAAASHYYEKQKFYYLGGLQSQAYALPSRVAVANEGSNKKEREEVAQDLQDSADLNSAIVLPFGYELKDPSGSAKSDMINFINHHDRQMALSILAQFLSLGSTSTGSYALSKDQTDLFNFIITSIEKNLEYHINAFVIPDLTKYNYEKPSFPKFKFANLTDTTMGVLENVFNQIISNKPEIITKEFAISIVKKLALQLNIDIDEIGYTTEEGATMSRERKACKCSHAEFDRKDGGENSDPKWHRELTSAEQKVNFSNINNKMNTFEQQMLEKSGKIINQMTAEAKKEVETALKDGDRRKAMAYRVSDKLKSEYHDILEQIMLDAYNYGKTAASGELKQQNIATPADTKRYITDYATSVVEKQASDIEFQVRQAIMSGNQVELALGKIPSTIAEIWAVAETLIGNWFNTAIATGISAMIASSLNRGRDDIFSTYQEKIKRMQYSAILDGKTCQQCRELDGTVVDYKTYKKSVWQPPIHFGCRCIWVAVMQEEELPAITGFQSSYGGYEAPSLI